MRVSRYPNLPVVTTAGRKGERTVDAQSIIWFAISIVALLSGVRLLIRRYVLKSPQAVQSRGSYTLFAVFMIIFALGAFVAGMASL